MKHDIIRFGTRDILSVAQLDSVAAWIDAARAAPTHYFTSGRKTRWSRNDGPADWYGHATFDEACQLARQGWRDGRERLARNLATIKTGQPVDLPQSGYDVAGAYPIVPRAVAGDPFCMMAPAEPERRAPVLTVRLWVGILGDVEPAAVMAWGAATASYVDALESAGYAVDLYAVAVARKTATNVTRWHAVRVSLKAPDQPLDLDRLAFAAAHPATHRRLNFAIRESAPQMIGSLGGTVQPADAPAWLRDALAVDGPAIDIPSAGVCGATDPVACAAFQARYFADLSS